jgi:hypothetical protein
MDSNKARFNRDRLKEIFREHWEVFKERNPRYRAARYEEAVQKMLGCGDLENGFATYRCLDCGAGEKKVAFSCKCNFCLPCGKVYTDRWARHIEEILLPGVSYRHTVLTVPEEVRIYFYRKASLLKELMKAGRECLEDVLRAVLRRKVRGGYIMVVQTNGRSGSYNPHVHIIMTAGGVVQGKQGENWVSLKYFPYEIVHKKWQYYLFKMLKEKVGTEQMKRLIDRLYRKYPRGLVANIQKGEVPKRIKSLAKYLAKYVVSPPISVRRIDRYDGKQVKYWYNDHKSGKRKEEEVDVYKFIGRMVQHILPRGMQRIGYYGLHATAVYEKIRKKIGSIVPVDAVQCLERFAVGRKRYRQMVIETIGEDPFQCPACGAEMQLWKIWHPKYGVIYDEEERLKAGYYDPVKPGGDRNVRDTGHPLLQLSLPGVWV